MQNTSDFLKH